MYVLPAAISVSMFNRVEASPGTVKFPSLMAPCDRLTDKVKFCSSLSWPKYRCLTQCHWHKNRLTYGILKYSWMRKWSMFWSAGRISCAPSFEGTRNKMMRYGSVTGWSYGTAMMRYGSVMDAMLLSFIRCNYHANWHVLCAYSGSWERSTTMQNPCIPESVGKKEHYHAKSLHTVLTEIVYLGILVWRVT